MHPQNLCGHPACLCSPMHCAASPSTLCTPLCPPASSSTHPAPLWVFPIALCMPQHPLRTPLCVFHSSPILHLLCLPGPPSTHPAVSPRTQHPSHTLPSSLDPLPHPSCPSSPSLHSVHPSCTHPLAPSCTHCVSPSHPCPVAGPGAMGAMGAMAATTLTRCGMVGDGIHHPGQRDLICCCGWPGLAGGVTALSPRVPLPAGSDLPVCASCGQGIYDGQYLQALKADWHADCFRWDPPRDSGDAGLDCAGDAGAASGASGWMMARTPERMALGTPDWHQGQWDALQGQGQCSLPLRPWQGHD